MKLATLGKITIRPRIELNLDVEESAEPPGDRETSNLTVRLFEGVKHACK